MPIPATFQSGSVGTSAANLTSTDMGIAKYGITIIPDINNSGQIYWRTKSSTGASPDITAGYSASTTDGIQIPSSGVTIPTYIANDARLIQVIGSAASQNYSFVVA